MIKIRKNFIQSTEGAWYNIDFIRSFYIGGCPESGYRICFSYEPSNESKGSYGLGFMCIGETKKTFALVQQQLDGIMELLEYDCYGRDREHGKE